MEIGKYLLKYNKFPSLIVDRMEDRDDKENKNVSKEVDSMTYKNKVLTEFSNTAYLELARTVNFDHVPKAIWNLWYDENSKYSVVSLINGNADDSMWKTLYEMFKKKFAKLK